MKTKKIDIPIYFGYLNIIVTEDGMEEVVKKYGLKIDISKYGAVVWDGHNSDGISEHYISIDLNCSGDLLAHEVVHLVNSVFLKCGVELDRHNDEPQAYLTGWMYKEVLKYLHELQTKKAKKRKKRKANKQNRNIKDHKE